MAYFGGHGKVTQLYEWEAFSTRLSSRTLYLLRHRFVHELIFTRLRRLRYICIHLFQKRFSWCDSEYHDMTERHCGPSKSSNVITLLYVMKLKFLANQVINCHLRLI